MQQPHRTSLFPYTTLFPICRDPVQHAFDVDVDRPIPVVDRETFERRSRHNTGVINHDIDTPEFLRGCIDRSEEHTSDSSHTVISYAVFCLKKKRTEHHHTSK